MTPALPPEGDCGLLARVQPTCQNGIPGLSGPKASDDVSGVQKGGPLLGMHIGL